MAPQDTNSAPTEAAPPPAPAENLENTIEDVADAVGKVSLHDGGNAGRGPTRPLRIYTRPQVLHLSKSPLVAAPGNMPALKEWFGDWNEQTSTKKDSDSSATPNARDRRFRRDADDGDATTRSSFRAGLSQPSQMGNFRHQSLRTTDRGGDKESDREKERDLRDREGQERLRNLSDKYDRERLALSSIRNKERDAAPHLTGTAASRLSQAQTTGRRGEGRDGAKRKAGESSDDWRRGAEPSRAGREDRADTGRRDRERPRSRARESSRPRRDPSPGRRERDRDREDRDRPRDRDRDDKDEFGRRPRDGDRDDDDSRHWRDDGRREERMAARRERWDRYEERDRERPSAGDDRDPRARRGAGRDRRTADEPKDRDDRKDREAEPAWMETYVPTTPGGGILGGKGADGELDGIQAWKKGLKEKERKEKGLDAGTDAPKKAANGAKAQSSSSSGGEGMDEIQLFKLMMKREAEKKDGDKPPNGALEGASPSSAIAPAASAMSLESSASSNLLQSSENAFAPSQSSVNGTSPISHSPNPQTASALADTVSRQLSSGSPSLERLPEASRVLGPRLHQISASPSLNTPQAEPSASSPGAAPFNPPAGSRVLALKSRVPSATAGIPGKAYSANDPSLGQMPPPGITPLPTPGATGLPPHLSDALASEGSFAQARGSPIDHAHNARSYSPLTNGIPHNLTLEDLRDQRQYAQMNDGFRKTSGPSAVERAVLGIPPDAGPSYGDYGGNGYPPGIPVDAAGGNYAANKGSRFAKFFEGKVRENPLAGPPRLGQQQPQDINQLLGQRQDALGGMQRGGEPRTMEDIFAMLQNSAQQPQRVSPQIPQQGRLPPVGNQFAQNLDLQILQQQQLHHQQQQQQQQQQHNRLESLYESRLDDRNFVPDGLVPGLRPAPPRSRSRESGGVLFNEQLDDPLHFNVNLQQRLNQQRTLEQMFGGGPVPGMYAQQGGMRNAGLPLQQGQFRGASPNQVQHQMPPQRLPPGLANLGGRPPHDPSQYLGGGGIHAPSPAQQVYQNFTQQGGLGHIGNLPQARGTPPGVQLNQLAGLGPDVRAVNQAQLLGLAQGGLRGQAPGGFGPQHGPGGQVPAAHLAMRQQLLQQQQQQQLQQQQQQHLPPHMLPHHLQSHLQQQGMPGGHAQSTQDLMALLMGGPRE